MTKRLSLTRRTLQVSVPALAGPVQLDQLNAVVLEHAQLAAGLLHEDDVAGHGGVHDPVVQDPVGVGHKQLKPSHLRQLGLGETRFIIDLHSTGKKFSFRLIDNLEEFVVSYLTFRVMWKTTFTILFT